MYKGNSKGFTLAELLMAVLVISIIMVALAPVITRRAYDTVSIEVNKKKGLEIFTNPGTYTFDVPIGINTLFLQGAAGGGGGAGATFIDKSISYTSNTTWTVPQGVNQLTFTITGSGGGGGAGYARNAGDDCVALYKTLPYMADNGKDICAGEPVDYAAGGYNELKDDFSGVSVSQATCWKKDPYWEDSSSLAICTYNGAVLACRSGNGIGKSVRLFTPTEMARINTASHFPSQGGYLGKNYLNLCRQYAAPGTNTPNMRHCSVVGKCFSADSLECNPYLLHISEAWLMYTTYDVIYSSVSIIGPLYSGYRVPTANTAGQVRCVYERQNWFQYSGAGGSSGAKYQKTISVLPNDTLIITIGAGGSGGSAGVSVNNGLNTKISNGHQGKITQIIHKRGSTPMGTYYVKGGFGGSGAQADANGLNITYGTSPGQTTPSGICYAQFRSKPGEPLKGGNTGCSSYSHSGMSGTELEGGLGGLFENSGTPARGGALDGGEGSIGTGYKAASFGYGGGGGTCARGVRNPSSCSRGGSGGSGKVDISYRISLPGGGGGSGARIGGAGADNKAYEIKYKVDEGSRLVIKVGSGGVGGTSLSDGINGEATVIGDNDIVFLAGEGGKASTESQKSYLISGTGGRKAYINQDGAPVTNALGLIIKNASKVKYSIAPPSGGFAGENGAKGQLKSGANYLNYGFDGGLGGAPFNIPSNYLSAARTCGGGTKGDTNTSAYCPNGTTDGSRALVHDPVNNQFGGSGGGGGGVIKESFTLGSGGSGSSGYLRLRWDETENESW